MAEDQHRRRRRLVVLGPERPAQQRARAEYLKKRGRDNKSTAWTMLNIAVHAPIPTARIRMAVAANPGSRTRRLIAYRVS